MTGKPGTKLLTARDVMALTGIGYAHALAIIKVHGILFGRKGYRITEEALDIALNKRGRIA